MGYLLAVMILVPLLGAGVVFTIGRADREAPRTLALWTTLLTFALSLWVVARYQTPTGASTQPLPGLQMELRLPWLAIGASSATPSWLEFYLAVDSISLWLIALTGLLMISAVLISWEAITERSAEFYALLLLLEAGMLGVFCAFDIILFYICFEFTLIPLFFLIGIWGGAQKTLAAGKFFIYTLTGSVFTLLGLVALVLSLQSRDENQRLTFAIPELTAKMARQMELSESAAAHVNLKSLADRESARRETKAFWYNAQFWIFLAFFAGFAIKVPLAPFHTWLPLAHVEAPTAGSVLLAGILLKLGSYGFMRLCLPLLPYASWNLGVPLVGILSIIGILYGSLCALAQSDIKKLVAYSSVAHLGFCMLGIFALNAEGITGGYMQMINHGLSTGALFLLVGMLYERYHTRQMSAMGGLSQKLPVLTFFALFTFFSSMGLPGLNGFIGETLALIGMFKARPYYAAAGALGIVLGAWYLLNIAQKVFFGPLKEPDTHGAPVGDMNSRELFAIVPIAILCVWLGVYPRTVLKSIKPDIEAIARVYSHPEKLQALPLDPPRNKER